jgi:AraC-like DNA-binding protein
VYVSNVVIRAVSAELRRSGGNADEALAAAGLDASVVNDATARISHRDESRFIIEAMRLTGRPDLGLDVGDAAPTNLLHVLGPLVMSVGSLRQASSLFLRYAPLLIEGASYELVDRPPIATIRYTNPHEDPAHARFCADLNIAFILRICERFVGQGEYADLVRFAHPRPSYAARYEAVFRCPVEFGCATNEIVGESRLLDLELVPPDEALRAILERRADELLSMLGSEITLDSRLRELLGRERNLSRASVSAIPSRLGVGMKTLQRRLSEVGVSFSELVEGEQKRRAFAALADTTIAIKEIAQMVGFSDSTTFHRAFKRWTGTTPAEYRRLRGEPTGDAAGEPAPRAKAR